MSARRILVVEDQRLVAADIANTLTGLGYAVAGNVGSGQAAVETAALVRPDLVLMDIRLGAAMDGIEAAAAIRRALDVPVVYLTAYADEETIARAKGTEPYGYLVKPFNVRELRAVIETALYKHDVERRMRARERWHATTLRAIGDAVVTVGSSGRVSSLNEAAAVLTGWSERDAAGRLPEEVCAIVSSGQPITPALLSLAPSPSSVVPEGAELVTRSGRRVPVDGAATAILDDEGALQGKVVVLRDATERLRAEQERARAAEERSRRQAAEEERARAAFLAEISAGLAASLDREVVLGRVVTVALGVLAEASLVLMTDSNGAVAQVAEAACRPELTMAVRALGEQPVPEAIARMVWEVACGRFARHIDDLGAWLTAEPRDDSGYAGALRGLQPSSAIVVPLECRSERAGVLLLLRCGGSGRRHTPGEIALAAEIGQRAALTLDNARLYREAQDAVGARDDFLLSAAHELRTPLTALLLRLHAVERAAAGDEPEAKRGLVSQAAMARRAAERLGRLVDTLVDVARLTTGRIDLRREVIDLVEVARKALDRMSEDAARAGCELRLRAEGGAPGEWDPARLDEALRNVLANAIKFGAGAPVEVTIEGEDGTARMSVRDHGIGVPSKDVERVFGPFERAAPVRSYGGMGLGLFLARRIVEAHGGRIRLESEPGAGALFTIELPRRTQAAEPAPLAAGRGAG